MWGAVVLLFMNEANQHVLCEVCGERFEVVGSRGITPRYCSNKCRQKAYRKRRQHALPAAMRGSGRWARADRKRPVDLLGAPLRWGDANNWSTYGEVGASKAGDGFGFFLGDGFACIDLDNCVLEDGSLSPLAVNLVAANPQTYIEWSRSGRGLHIFGLMPERAAVKMPGFELYSHSRFIQTTGNVFQRGELRELNTQL